MIRIENLHVRYPTAEGEVHAVRGINIDIAEGEFYTLLGPSGCGKTTTLRCLAGLETASEGTITIGDEVVYSRARNILVPPHKRNIGMVFQSYAIWPHMSVFENVAFPLREMRGKFSREEIRDKVARALKLVQLDGLQDRPAPFLSGGQQQRLALARALVREPKVLLLDEPLSNLDAKLRESTRLEVRDLVKRLGITTVYVTHDQLEALTMSDRVAVMKQGEIVQEADPVELYQAPRERFVANFIGQSNFIEGKVSALPASGSEIGTAVTSSGQIKCILPAGFNLGDPMLIAVRPEDITVVSGGCAMGGNVVEGKVSATSFMGDSIEYQVMVAGAMMRMKLHPSTGVRQGDTIRLNLPEESCRALLP